MTTLFDGVTIKPELAQAAYALGVQRAELSIKLERPNRYGFNPSDEERKHTDGMGAMAEWFVSHVTGRKWLAQAMRPDDPILGDLEGGIGVRWTKYRNGGLPLHPEDPDANPFVLVTGEAWPLRIVGWVYGHEGKQPEYWRTDGVWARRPCYLVRPWRSIAVLVKSR